MLFPIECSLGLQVNNKRNSCFFLSLEFQNIRHICDYTDVEKYIPSLRQLSFMTLQRYNVCTCNFSNNGNFDKRKESRVNNKHNKDENQPHDNKSLLQIACISHLNEQAITKAIT